MAIQTLEPSIRPASPGRIRSWLRLLAHDADKDGVQNNPRLRGVIVGWLEKYCERYERYILLAWLFGDSGEYVKSSKTLTEGQVYALQHWLDTIKVEENEWAVSDEFRAELPSVLSSAIANFTGRFGGIPDDVVIDSFIRRSLDKKDE